MEKPGVSNMPTGRKRRRAPAGEQKGEQKTRKQKTRGRGLLELKQDEGASARIRARPYLLVTARMPVQALTSTWSLGQNRPVDERHVRQLRSLFDQGGLNRQAIENRLFVLCRREDVERMQKHLEEEGEASGPPRNEEHPYFRDWLSVVRRPAELMAGQHRTQALRQYVASLGSRGDDDLWWTCELYDHGRWRRAWHLLHVPY
jgi:hypothetical protein